ncbi:MAG: hypothetical protein DMD79_12390 [Candidatus Rokuibacteriota bacterium]|nr:MAG: hypothetical protein DMD79_12390 [Candidatus Rokubacteria bacterium]
MPPRGWQRRVERLALDLRPRFVADVMLGRLARWLRALGYDTAYVRDASDRQLLGLALREDRRLLTRDVALARLARERGLLVRADGLDDQLREVVQACGLTAPTLLTRCLECNVPLEAVGRDAVRDRVPSYTFATQRAFRTCRGCARVYWPGTHAAGILDRLRPFLAASGRP